MESTNKQSPRDQFEGNAANSPHIHLTLCGDQPYDS